MHRGQSIGDGAPTSMTRHPALAMALIASAAAFGSASFAASETADQIIILTDQQPYFQGSYEAYASPWSTFFDNRLVRGTDFLDTITVYPATFPDGTVIDSRWPLTKPEKSGVWGYHALSFGNYDGGHPPVLPRPQQVKDIHELSEEFEFSYEGSGNFNLLNEFYLTSLPGDAAAKVIEIGIFLHVPESTVRFIRSGEQIGVFTDQDGQIWKITQAKGYVMIVADGNADVRRGRADLRQILAFLMAKNVITGEEWFNGLAFGMEPVEGAGRTQLRIEHWRVVYR